MIDARPPISGQDLYRGLLRDFERAYLFSGEIDSNLYSEDCEFTDPTISFRGLSAFTRNIQAIKPLIATFLGQSLVTLYSLDLEEEEKEEEGRSSGRVTVARWRMEGALRLPWRPVIDVQGVTRYKSSADRDGGRIVDYREEWTEEPTRALLRLLQPAAQKQERLRDKLSTIAGADAGAGGAFRPQSVLHAQVVERALALARSRAGGGGAGAGGAARAGGAGGGAAGAATAGGGAAAQEIRRLAETLSLHDTRRSSRALLVELSGTAWDLAWTDAKGGSSGQIGPLKGQVTQRFATTAVDEIRFVNSVSLAGGALVVDLHAVASARDGDGDGDPVIDVRFERTEVRVLGVAVKSQPTDGRGFWRIKFSDKGRARVFTTNAGSVFILTAAAKRL